MKNIRIFLSEKFQFLVVKFSVYLNRHCGDIRKISKFLVEISILSRAK